MNYRLYQQYQAWRLWGCPRSQSEQILKHVYTTHT